ncbi:MAG: mechanosensitive ion channel family protein [Fimbriimonadaceae bacterium]|nr:mechanosensitive ion channel family protein [Fimbriimonadaceae bacterium]
MRWLFSIVLALAAGLAIAQAKGVGAPVQIDGRPVFSVYVRVGSFSPAERARIIEQRFQKIADDPRYDINLLRVEDTPTQQDIYIGQELLVSLGQADADIAGKPLNEYGTEALTNTVAAIRSYRESRSTSALTRAAALSLVAILLILASCRLIKILLDFLCRKLYRIPRSFPLQVKLRDTVLINRKSFKRLFRKLIQFIKRVGYLVVSFFGLSYILGLYPWTREYSDQLLGLVGVEVSKIGKGFVAQIPNFLAIATILLIAWPIIRGLRLLFRGLETGQLSWPGFERDWAMPTFKLIRLVVIAAAAIAIFPYLPGSASPAFQGISVFAGVLLSLGSSGAVSNMVAGIVLTYMRPFRLGDRIKVGETIGDVIERNLLITRIRTIKNVEITVPNSVLLGAHIENYSAAAHTNGLILHTSVTIGYDVPWQKVHELLISAAKKTSGIVLYPAPFVLQTALSDFYVEYQINGYTRSPQRMALIYSQLLQNIQDAFAEAGIEIMSPHYSAIRDGSSYALPPEAADGLPPTAPFRVQTESGDQDS